MQFISVRNQCQDKTFWIRSRHWLYLSYHTESSTFLNPTKATGCRRLISSFIMLSSGKAADLSRFRLEQIKEMASLHNTLEVCSGFGRETRFFIRGFKAWKVSNSKEQPIRGPLKRDCSWIYCKKDESAAKPRRTKLHPLTSQLDGINSF